MRVCFGQIVTTELFPTLGVGARLGRTFLDAEGVSGQDHVVVLSDRMWRDSFGADPQVLGQSVSLNNEPYRVVGVMPPGFSFPDDNYQLWVPAALNGGFFQKFPDAHLLRVVGRLRENATRAALQQNLDGFTRHLAERDPDAKRRVYALDLQTAVMGDFEKPLLLLMCAVAALLLIACANVANLVLSRATVRAREFAIRAAIGATRTRLAAQVMIESLLLGLLGGGAGLAVGVWGVEWLIRLNPGKIPFLEQTRLDFRVLLFTLAISVAASCFFGLGPAVSTSGLNLVAFVRQSGRGMVGGSGRRLRRGLVFAQVALATVLLIGAGVMIRSLMALEGVPSGIRAAGVLTGNVVMTEQRYPESAQMLAFYYRVLEEMRHMPGVTDAAIATHLPFTGQGWGNGFEVEGRRSDTSETYLAQIRPVSPHYFSTLGIPLERGRVFDDTDTPTSLPVVIINATLEKRFWPEGDAIGKRIHLDGSWRTIVGIARDVKPGRLDAPPGPEIYFPYVQFAPQTMKFLGRGVTMLVHSSGEAQALVPELRAAVSNADKSMGVREIRPMVELIGGTVAQPRFRALLFGIFSSLALMLAAVGIYGVTSYSVTQRVQEIGVRIALGASARDILGMVMRDGATVALAGIAAGVLAALALGRLVATLLFEIKSGDPATVGAVCLLLFCVALAASFVPAIRATRLDPTTSLRRE
jgi:putative ABC transport system permease protein